MTNAAMLRSRKGVSWMMGVTVLEYAECLVAIVFPSSLVWSVSIKKAFVTG